MAVDLRGVVKTLGDRDDLLDKVQDRVMWLAVNMVHHANKPKGEIKVGGHQASSASLATVMTYLYFEFMSAGDRLSLKPHASPVYHAIQFLLGNLPGEYLEKFRGYGGLQAYPSQTKDPDGVDFSTGSVGLGPVTPNFAALAERYVGAHFRDGGGDRGRFISVLGDAELNEGSVWEALSEAMLRGLDNLVWVVDLNRQSLDGTIPGIRADDWREMFRANGWRVVDAKYGKRLEEAYAKHNGHLLRGWIDKMTNERYQWLLRQPPDVLRKELPEGSDYPYELRHFANEWNDDDLHSLFRNLGGHDFSKLREAFDEVNEHGGPAVVFAYTFKGWNLPTIGDPSNHSKLLNGQQMAELRETLKIHDDEVWSGFDPSSPEGLFCSQRAKELARLGPSPTEPELKVPTELQRTPAFPVSTQAALALSLTEISREVPELASRIVTASPDVATSTGLAGWMNKAGVWSHGESRPHLAGRTRTESAPKELKEVAVQYVESDRGQHIQLGISENNLFMLLGQLGLSHEREGELLFPIGTLYDCFVRRGLDALFYSTYSGSKFIFAGTPSGISLAPEGGAHQSLLTQSIGTELPDVSMYEPCFAKELEWILLDAVEQVKDRRRSTYLRLSTRPIDQKLLTLPTDSLAREQLRRQVLDGAYRLVDRSREPGYGQGYNIVNIMTCGAIVPEAVEASRQLMDEGVYANVINVTGPGPLYRRFQDSVHTAMKEGGMSQPFMADVIYIAERSAPIVTVVDGHPHSLAWIGAAMKTATFPLGVTRYGQSGTPSELYAEYGIDVSSIMSACFAALGI